MDQLLNSLRCICGVKLRVEIHVHQITQERPATQLTEWRRTQSHI